MYDVCDTPVSHVFKATLNGIFGLCRYVFLRGSFEHHLMLVFVMRTIREVLLFILLKRIFMSV